MDPLEALLKPTIDTLAEKLLVITDSSQQPTLEADAEEVNGIETSSWATSQGIKYLLHTYLSPFAHILVTDIKAKSFPLAKVSERASPSAKEAAYRNAIIKLCSEFIANCLKTEGTEKHLVKPIVMIFHKFPSAKSSRTAQAASSSSTSINNDPLQQPLWAACIILPKNYKPLCDKYQQLANSQESVFYIDSQGFDIKLPRYIKNIISFSPNLNSQGLIPTAKFIENNPFAPLENQCDSGWFAVYDAMIILLTGNAAFLPSSRDPQIAIKLRQLFPELTNPKDIIFDDTLKNRLAQTKNYTYLKKIFDPLAQGSAFVSISISHFK